MKEKNFLLSIDTKKIKYGLIRTQKLLAACNSPQKNIKAIQVVGTNGKGTTCAMLANVLINNNYKVGLFTSPHLIDINERISVNFKNIPDSYIKLFINQYKNKINDIQPSFFEIMTVLSICYFKYMKVDFAILETGLGGRLDSITAVQSPIILFTSISYDHMSILGDTLEKIAKEKIGALTEKTQKIYSVHQPGPVKRIFKRHAAKLNKNIHFISTKNPSALQLKYLQGIHQKENAQLAIYTLYDMAKIYNIKLQNIIQHIGQTFWPGRIQYINTNPDILFDVGHNESGIDAFCKYFKTILKNYNKKYLVVGFEDGKEVSKALQSLTKLFDNITITETKIRNSMKAEKIKLLLTDVSVNIESNPQKAISNNVNIIEKKDVLVILGSHYFGPHLKSIFKNCFDKPSKYP